MVRGYGGRSIGVSVYRTVFGTYLRVKVVIGIRILNRRLLLF